MSTARQIAAKLLVRVEENDAYSNLALDAELKSADLGQKDTAFVTRVFYGVIERKITIDYVISRLSKKPVKKLSPTVLAVLRVALYQLMYMDKIPPSAVVNEAVKTVKKSRESYASGFVNGVLRGYLRNPVKIPCGDDFSSMQIKYSCPEWFCRELSHYLGETETALFLQDSLNPAPTYLRVNTFLTDVESLASRISDSGAKVSAAKLENALVCSDGGAVKNIVGFSKGEFFVQDISCQYAIAALGIQSGDTVLDVCAAPGGKSCNAALYAEKGGSVTACDIHNHRVKLIADNAERLCINTVNAVKNDATMFNNTLGLFDRVICDVPCSGYGVIRRKPEIKYKNPTDLTNLPQLQYNILATSSRYLKKGGCLLYSTCTLRRAENEDVVERFLNFDSSFTAVETASADGTGIYHRLLPQNCGGDGFFFTVIRKER